MDEGNNELINSSYLDFEIEIGSGNGREYPVFVNSSVSGEARETMHFPFDELALENQLLALQNALLRSGGHRRKALSQEEQVVQNFGKELFDALFTEEIGNRYAVSQSEARSQSKGLRLKLRIQPPELAALPWEFLYDLRAGEYVCLSNKTPIVRYLELPQPLLPLNVTTPLSILGMTCSPKNLSDLDVEREKQRIEKALEVLKSKGMVKLTWLPGHTWQDLQRAIRGGPWHIFHFIGHGGFDAKSDEGLITFEDSEGKSDDLSATQVGRLLSDHHSLRLIVLNSCEGGRGSQYDIFSSTAAILVRRGIPAVLAMQYEITDRAAIELSRVFYEALADGMPVDASVSEARKAISMKVANTIEWGVPVLYMRSPDGVLFNLLPKSTATNDQPKQSAPEPSPLPKPSIATNDQPKQSAPKPVLPPKPSDPDWYLHASAYQETIANIEIMFTRMGLRKIASPPILEDFEEVIRNIMTAIGRDYRFHEYRSRERGEGSEEVLELLGKACDEIYVALDIIEEGKRTVDLYQGLRQCQQYLRLAINMFGSFWW